MDNIVFYDLPVALCLVALPFTGILPILCDITKRLVWIVYEVARFILLMTLTLFLVVMFSPWIFYGLFWAVDNSSEPPEYRAMMKKHRKAEKYFRRSLGDFMIQRDKNTWPHIDITISMGYAIIVVNDRSHSGIKLEPMRYKYKMDGRQIITENGQILSRDDFENEIDDLLKPHTIEPPSMKS